MIRTLGSVGGRGGGPVKLAENPGKARNIHVTIANTTAVAHAAFFGRSRREIDQPPPTGVGFMGYMVPALPNTVPSSPVSITISGVCYTSEILFGWVGELWAVGDVGELLAVDIFDSGAPEV
jgi:hypothetical protein